MKNGTAEVRGHYGSVKGMNWFGDVEDPISWMHIMHYAIW